MMDVLVLAPTVITLWQVALAIGAVVLIAVVLLLGMLLHFVRAIDTGVSQLWNAAQRLATNTDNLKKVDTLNSSLEDVRDEALLHDRLLGGGR